MQKPETVKDILEHSAQKFKYNCAFTFLDNEGKKAEINYKETKKDVDCLATALLHECRLQGKKAAIIGFNSYEWCISYLACLSAGIVAVPVDRELSAEDIREILDFAGVKTVLCDGRTLQRLSVISGRSFISFAALGEDVKERQAQRTSAIFSDACRDADVNLIRGGQPVYYYMISAE